MPTTATLLNTRFKNVPYPETDSAVKAIYEETLRILQLPFALNWLKCQSRNAILLRGNGAKLHATLIEGEVPNILSSSLVPMFPKNAVVRTAPTPLACLSIAGVAWLAKIQILKQRKNLDAPLLPNSYSSAIKLVIKAALKSGETNRNFEKLLQESFTGPEVQELPFRQI